MNRSGMVVLFFFLASCSGAAEQPASLSETTLSPGVDRLTTVAPTTTAVTTTTVAPTTTAVTTTTVAPTTTAVTTTTSSVNPSGSGYFPFNSSDPALRNCLIEVFGQALYQELNTRPPSQSEGAAMGPCMGPARTDGPDSVDPDHQPGFGSTVSCELGAPPTPSTGWIIENDGILDYQVLGHSPGRDIGGAADPRVVRLDDGRYRMYFAQPGEYGLGAAISTDGVNWTVENPMVIPSGKGGHVSVLRLDDGSWRLFSAASMTNLPGEIGVSSFVSEDGTSFTQEDGYRLTEQDFPYGDINSPLVIREPGGGYRMYLTAVPEGETSGQPGGNTKAWLVSATSADMINWTVDPAVVIEDPDGLDWTGIDVSHPWVGISETGLFEMYSGGGGPATKRTSVDGRTFSDPVYLPLIGADYHVEYLPNGESRLYHSSGTMDTGGDIRILRSTEVSWDVDFLVGGFQRVEANNPDSLVVVLEVCVKGSSSRPLEIQLLTGAGPFAIGERNRELEASALSVRSGYPPFQSTLKIPEGEDSRWFSGGQGVETLVRVSDGVAMKEWMVLTLLGGQAE